MLEALLNNLNSRDEAVRAGTMRETRGLPPETLLQLIEREARHQRRQRQGFLSFCLGAYFVGALIALVRADAGSSMALFAGVCTLLPFLLGGVEVVMARPTRAMSCLMALIEEKQDALFIPPALLLAQESDDADVRASISAILRPLLLSLRYDHVRQWTKAQKASLLLPLKSPLEDTGLTLCVLRALEQAGDAEAIPAVERLNSPVWGRRIFQAANECLPFLQARADQHRLAQTLLRPSACSAETSDVLLRPAMGTTDGTPSEQLLRPSPPEA